MLLFINGVTCFFQFSPDVNTAWLCYACNKLRFSAIYLSPFARVHHVNAIIGDGDKGSLAVSSMKSREEDLKLLETFRKSCDEKKSQETKHKLELEFMAHNGLKKIGGHED